VPVFSTAFESLIPYHQETNMKNLLRGVIAAVAFAGASFSASAAVFSPFDAIGSSEQVASVTPGYVASWWVEDATVGVSPGAGQSPADIRAFVEQSAITGMSMTDNGCREGLGGVSGSNSKCTGSIFAIKVNDLGYLVFEYASAIGLDAFMISMVDSSANNLSRMDVFSAVAPDDVPLPGAILLLGSGLAGLGALGRRRVKGK
jgi:PEP-CTERM motif